MADNKDEKNAKTWGRDVAIFGAGMATGALGTAIVGHLTNGKVPVPKPMADAMSGAAPAKK